VFIDLVVGQIYSRSWGGRDEWELDALSRGALVLQQNGLDTGQDQFSDRASFSCCLGLKPPVQWARNVDGGANRSGLHEAIIAGYAINMEAGNSCIIIGMLMETP
jgi:hypothetical protein